MDNAMRHLAPRVSWRCGIRPAVGIALSSAIASAALSGDIARYVLDIALWSLVGLAVTLCALRLRV